MTNRETALKHKTVFTTRMDSPYQVNSSVYFVSVQVNHGLAAAIILAEAHCSKSR
jgi:hypothetical protein